MFSLEKMLPANGAECPGGTFVIECNTTFSSHFSSDEVERSREPLSSSTLPLQSITSFKGFIAMAHAVAPDYTIMDSCTALLQQMVV